MARISSAELQRKFGTYSEMAQREPVTITNHGRDSLVLLSRATFERMSSAYYTARHYYAWELPQDAVQALETELERLEEEDEGEAR
jgi:prevent-host-death family protein